ncbi:MAG: Holliday junction resolvase RuvX [Lentisphaerae bacterium]|nr:Holliday junction resolvase RuvX [Lentisphaerota bacterium]
MGSVIAGDYGEKRIGIAVSDPFKIIAMPLTVIQSVSLKQDIESILKICAEKEAERLVVGLPLNMDGSAGAQAEKTLKFIEKLRESLSIPVDTWDERLTSKQAERTLIEADMSRARREQLVDKLSAQIFLQSYLDANEQI